MSRAIQIQVRDGSGALVETITRKAWRESIGNFCPLFCRYRRKRCLVESDALHVDEAMRFDASEHEGKYFIQPRGADGKVVATWEGVS